MTKAIQERADNDVARAQLALDHCRRQRDQLRADLHRADAALGAAEERLQDAKKWAEGMRATSERAEGA